MQNRDSDIYFRVRQRWVQTFGSQAQAYIYSYIATFDENKRDCCVSVDTIAAATMFSVRAVYKTLHELEAMKAISVERKPGGKSVYTAMPIELVNPCTTCTPAPRAPLHHVHPTPAPHAGVINNNTIIYYKKREKKEIAHARMHVHAHEERTEPFVMSEQEPLYAAMVEWLAYKKERRQSYRTDRTLRACYERLKELSGGDEQTAAAIVKQSIANNWAGLFALKSNNYGTNRNNNSKDERALAAIIAGINAANTECAQCN